MFDHIVLIYPGHGLHILHMKPEYVKVQKHCVNESHYITIPYRIAKAIPLVQSDLMKTVLDGKRVIMEKV
jgi:hypothetical protein